MNFILENETNRFTCIQCRKTYSAKGSLARHIKYECPFNATYAAFHCPYCNHTSRRKDHLKCHILTHIKVDKK